MHSFPWDVQSSHRDQTEDMHLVTRLFLHIVAPSVHWDDSVDVDFSLLSLSLFPLWLLLSPQETDRKKAADMVTINILWLVLCFMFIILLLYRAGTGA